MRYSAKDIEDAALICAIAASSDHHRNEPFYSTIAVDLDAKTKYGGPKYLAVKAWLAAAEIDGGRDWLCDGWSRERDAEAEAILRCGWLPPGASRSGKRGRR